MSETAAIFEELTVARPRVARLAVLTSVPVRVAPELVRLARLRLVHGGGTADEADLWLSDLVETRSAAGFSYRRAAREFLRGRLRADVPLLDDLWSQVHLERAPWLTARGRLEEELTWRLLRNPADEEIGRLWEGVIGELDTAAKPEGIARWILRAMPDLPEGSLTHAAGRRAFYGASLLLGDAAVLGSNPQYFQESGGFAFATRHLERRRIFVGLSAQGLIVSPSHEIENGHELDIPSTTPLWLQLEDPTDTSEPFPKVVLFGSDEQQAVSWRPSPLSFRTIDGALYRLERGHRAYQSGGSRRPSRVELTYDVEVYGSLKKVQLPFVVGVVADLVGHHVEPLPPLRERKCLEIDRDNFETRMGQLKPRIDLRAPIGDREYRVNLQFTSMDDFTPTAIAERLEPLRELLDSRRSLVKFQVVIAGNEAATALIDAEFAKTDALSWLAQLDPEEVPRKSFADTLLAVLERETPEQRQAVAAGIVEVARAAHAAGERVTSVWDAASTYIERFDARLSRLVEAILHHEAFQRLEASWRGLYELVQRTDTNDTLKIRVLPASKDELLEALDADEPPLFRQFYEVEYGQFGGEPYGLIVADLYITPSAADANLFRRLTEVCRAAAVPLVAGADASFVGLESWSDWPAVVDVDRAIDSSSTPEWNRLREEGDSRFIGLALPRFLARVPYSTRTDADLGFAFEEGVNGVADYVWANAAYAMAINVARAFTLYGWCARIAGFEGGGAIELPAEIAGAAESGRGSTEVPVSDRQEVQLTRYGLMALVAARNGNHAAFFSTRPVHHGSPAGLAMARSGIPSTDWRWLLPASRFMHYIKCIVRDTLGSFGTAEQLERYLRQWLSNYVDNEPLQSNEADKVRRPLAAAQLRVEDEGNGDGWILRVRLLPHYQADRVEDALRTLDALPEFVARVPKVLSA